MAYSFKIDNGGDDKILINNELLDSEQLCTIRAESEFLKTAYFNNTILFKTTRLNLKLNQVVLINQVPYKIKSISITISKGSIISTVRGLRYEY